MHHACIHLYYDISTHTCQKKWDWNYAAELKIMIMYQYTTWLSESSDKAKERRKCSGT